MTKKLILTIPLTILLIATVHARNTETIYRMIKAEYTKLTKSKRARAKRKNWERIIYEFLDFRKRYPNCERADDALFMAGRMRYELYGYSGEKRDLDYAIKNFQRVVKYYPKSNLADDALYHIGLCYEKKGWKQSAYKTYDRLLKRYPRGDMAARAKRKLKRLAKYRPPDTAYAKGAGRRARKPKKAAVADKLFDVRCWSNPLYSRVVIYIGKTAAYDIYTLPASPKHKKKPRIVVDVKGVSVSRDVPKRQTINDSLISTIRVGQFSRDVARVVLDLEHAEEYRHFHLTNPYRIVIDVGGEAADEEGEREIETIIIDAGHGGHDSGAVSFGIKEKDVVLKLARLLKSKLEERTDLEILLTRDRDVFIPLEARTAFANQRGGDIFISLHMNAAKNRDARGLEIYYLSPTRNQEALELAALENNSSVADVKDINALLEVADLMLLGKMGESEILADTVREEVRKAMSKRYGSIQDRGVKRAPFYVLAGAQMPCILIEGGFLTNPHEAKLLTDPNYLDALAEGIAEGVIRYIREYEGE